MSAKVTSRKPTKAGQRVRFSCTECGAYGDCSGDVDATEFVVKGFLALHEHATQSPGAGDSDRLPSPAPAHNA